MGDCRFFFGEFAEAKDPLWGAGVGEGDFEGSSLLCTAIKAGWERSPNISWAACRFLSKKFRATERSPESFRRQELQLGLTV